MTEHQSDKLPVKADTQQFAAVEIDHSSGDRAAKVWFLMSVLWFPVFASLGFILAMKFFVPDFIGDTAWFTFGVVRPAHTNGVLFGFVSSGLIGAMLWITPASAPRLCTVQSWQR